MERKIFNFKSEILIKETIEKYGYHPDSFGKASSKFIVASCRFCGKASDIRKGFFNKTGSACHKQCRFEEQRLNSPFKNAETRAKAKKAIEDKYGIDRKEIGRRISVGRRKASCINKTKDTCLEKYGVENVFQNEEIKEKIKRTCIDKYGVDNPQKNKNIKDKTKRTNVKKYGVEHPLQNKEIKRKALITLLENYIDNYYSNEDIETIEDIKKVLQNKTNPNQLPEIKEKAKQTYIATITENKNGNFNLINTLRNNEEFWHLMKDGKYSIRELADKFSLNCNSLSSALLRSEFKDKYYEYYSFPVQQMQNKVYEIIQTITDKQIIQNDKKVISPYELDIYIPDLNFAIEFNGSYWHSEATIPHEEARVKHCNKTKLCENKGIRLFHIFENEWKSRSTQILNFIKTIVGSNAINIAARKCQLKIEDPIVNSKDFMDNNHIQGHTTAIKYFNLYYNDEIVASMSAAKHHRQGQDAKTIVLSRLCMKDGYNVQGGPSKLFKAFKQWSIENGYNRVLSWSDNCWTQGRIYNVLGFRLDIEFGPDYFYWSPIENRYYSKQSQKKSATGCPKEIKEHEWCASKGLYRIWDCGKKRWIFEL